MDTKVGRDLFDRWMALARPDSEHVGVDLVARYSEPHRRYHTCEHLAAMLAAIDDLAEYAEDIAAVRYAAFFHDAIYAVDRADNEERSAELAESTLVGLGAAPELVREVGRLVRLTITHNPDSTDHNGAVLCDADLVVLASDAAGYAAYTAAVRAEYRHVPDDMFRIGRAAVLQELVRQPHLFRTPRARELYEPAARANLTTELAALQA